MATVTPDARDSSARPPKGAGQAMGYDEYIERQIARTRQHVKWVDIAGTLMTLAGGTLAFLLAVALIDHWLLGEGLGFAGRLLALVALVAYAYLLEPLGFLVSTFLAVAAVGPLLGARPWQAGAAGGAIAVVLFVLFDTLLGLPLPAGVLDLAG